MKASCSRRRQPAARSSGPATEPTLKAFLTKRADAFPVQRLLRQRRRLDGIEGRDGTDDRTLRSLRRRVASTTRRPSNPLSPFWMKRRRPSSRNSAVELQDIENHLPIDPKYRNPKNRRRRPIRRRRMKFLRPATPITACKPPPSICRTMSASPNEKGSKRVMLKNVQDAKFAEDAGADFKSRAATRDQRSLPSTLSSARSSITN